MRGIFVLIVLMILISGCAPTKDCGNNIDCFKEFGESCSKVKAMFKHEGSDVLVTIRGIRGNSCVISFNVKQVGNIIVQKYPEATAIVGKTMNCNIDLKYAEKEVSYIEYIRNLPENFDKSCYGSVKDLAKGPVKDLLEEEFNKLLEK